MPLFKCPDCDKEVSTAAITCPHCGRPVTGPKPAPKFLDAVDQTKANALGNPTVLRLLAVVILLAIIIAAWQSLSTT